MKGWKVLVTGGFGFIGSNVAHRCASLGAQVSIIDNLEPHSGGNLHNIEGLESPQILVRDIANPEASMEAVLGKDAVFHCAAITSHSFSMREPFATMKANVQGTLSLLEAVRRTGSGCRFIQVGTTTQIGPLRFRPATEDHPEFPLDVYSASKSTAEKLALVYARAFGIRATAARLSNIYGPRASIHSPEFTFNNYFIGLAMRDMAITVFGDGQQLRNVLFVEDAVDALVELCLKMTESAETYLVVADEHPTVGDVAEATVRAIGKGRVQYVPWPSERKSIEIGDAVLSNDKIKAAVGWRPRVALEEGLARTAAYYRENLSRYVR
jgi:UDP-glucose 4-epimerase